MTVFRAATLQTFFFAFHAGAKELKSHRAGWRIFYKQIILMRSQQRDYQRCLLCFRISLIAIWWSDCFVPDNHKFCHFKGV